LPANVRSLIKLFFLRVFTPEALAAAVTVEHPAPGETKVTIDMPLPWPPFVKKGHGYRITSKSLALRSDHFPQGAARDGVTHNKEKKRGRILNCQQLREPQSKRADAPKRDQVLAGLSFHIDPKAAAPVIVTHLAIRGDSDEARAMSLAAAGWMMFFLLEVARQEGRPDEVGVEIGKQPNPDDFSEIGFRPRATPAMYDSPYWAFRRP
jgi:hypothetical protein